MEFQTIIKKIENKLSSAEEIEFQKWYRSSEKHRTYYHRVKTEFQQEHYHLPSTSKAWKKIDRRLFISKRKNYGIAIGTVAIITLLLTIPFWNSNIPHEVKITSTPSVEKQSKDVLLIDEHGQQKLIRKGAAVRGDYYHASGQSLTLKNVGPSEKVKTDSEAIKMNTIVVPKGIQFSVELADGSMVLLNSDTKFSFPSSFKGQKNRLVRIEYGEAYFEITSSKQNDDQKFIVQNKDQQIEVLGTVFNVNAYPEKENLTTTLVEGSVRIISGKRSLKLIPGQQSLVSRENFEIRNVDVLKEISWTQGKFIFDNESLDEIMQVVGRWYDVKVDFEHPHLRDLLFNGVLNKNQQLEEILEILKNTNKAKFEFNGSTIKIMDNN